MNLVLVTIFARVKTFAGTFYKRQQQHKHLYVCFFLPAFIMWVGYITFSVFPFGERSVLVLDLNGQYVYYFDYMKDVLAGNESLLYSWSRNLSGEMMGIIGYYLGSPFNWLVYMFPRECITEGLLVMSLAKIGAAGLCFGIFLENRRKTTHLTTILFSLMYALSAYPLVQIMNPMWIDGVIALPLVIYGLECLMEQGKVRLFVFSLIYCFVTNYYIGYMVGIFSFLYFIYLFFSDEIYKEGVRGAIQKCAFFALSAVSAVLSSAFMLLPVYYSLQLGKLEFTQPDFTPKADFTLVDALSKLFPFSYDTVRPEGLPILYSGLLALIFVPVFFLCKKIPLSKRVGGGILLGILILCMYVSTIDMVWHGFQVPNWLPYRYSFVLIFLLISFAAQGFDRIKSETAGLIAGIAAGVIGFLVYYESTGAKHLDKMIAILPSMLIITILALVSYFAVKNRSAAVMYILITAVSGELLLNWIDLITDIHKDVVYSTRPSYNDFMIPLRKTVNGIKENDAGFYRIEKTFHRTVNDPMALRMYGLSHSSSALNATPIEFLRLLGFTSRGHYTRYDGATPITNSLLGVKYIISNELEEYEIETNEYALPMAFLVSDRILETKLSGSNPFELQNKMLSDMIGGEYKQFFVPITEYETVYENISKGKAGEHDYYVPTTEGLNTQIEHIFYPDVSAPVYMFLPSVYERQLNVWLNKEFMGNYYELENYNIKSLGSFEAGEEYSLILTLTKDDLYIQDEYYYYLDENLTYSALSNLKETNVNTVVTRKSGTHISIDATAAENQVLFTSIPYEPGWTVKIDGKKADFTESMDAMITIPITAGNHKIDMTFFPAGLTEGIILSVVGIGFIVFMYIFSTIIIRETETNLKMETEEDTENSKQ